MLITKVYASGSSGNKGSSIQRLIQGGKDKWAYSDSELKRLAKAHKNGDDALKRQIEARLTDINFHTEASSFREGTYTLLSEMPQHYPAQAIGGTFYARSYARFVPGRARTRSRG